MKIRLRDILAKADLSVTDVASQAELGRSVVSKLANLSILPANTKLETLYKICIALNIELNELIEPETLTLKKDGRVFLSDNLLEKQLYIFGSLQGELSLKPVTFCVQAFYSLGDDYENELSDAQSQLGITFNGSKYVATEIDNNISARSIESQFNKVRSNLMNKYRQKQKLEELIVTQVESDEFKKLTHDPVVGDTFKKFQVIDSYLKEGLSLNSEGLNNIILNLVNDPDIVPNFTNSRFTSINIEFLNEHDIHVSSNYLFNEVSKRLFPLD